MTNKKKKHTIERKYRNINAIIILLFAGFIIYSNSLKNPFAFDDFSSIVNNEDIKKPTIFTNFNRPRYVAIFTLALNYRINELSTFGYHLVNLSIHIINSILVFFLLRLVITLLWQKYKISINDKIPLITALIFVSHPIQTQAVTYIVQRMASLAALFALLAIFYYLKFRNTNNTKHFYFIISIISALLAYKTKENTATLPLSLIMLDLLLFSNEEKIKKRIFFLIPYVVLLAVIPLSFINLNLPISELLTDFSQISAQTQKISRSEYLFTEFNVIRTYLRLLILPINQAIDYYYPISNSLFEVKTILSFILIIILIGCLIIIYKWHPIITIGILWFFIFLLVESSIIPIRDVIFEHRLYLPGIGFFFAQVYLVYRIFAYLRNEKLATILFICIIITLSVCTYHRNKIWSDEIALWQDAANKFPQNARALSNLGVALARNNACNKAIEQLQKALAINDKDSNTWYNLAFCYKTLGLIDKAIPTYKKVLELRPDFQKAAVDLAMIYIARRKTTEAYNVLTEINKYHPEHPYNNALLAHVLCETGNVQKSITDFEKAVIKGLDYADIFFNYAICLLEHNKLQESRKNLFRAAEINPKDFEAIYFIGITYYEEKNFNQASYYFKLYLENSPNGRWAQDIKNKLSTINTFKN